MAKTTKKKKNIAKAVATIITFAVILAIIVGGAIWGTGFALTGKYNPTQWGGDNNTAIEDEPNGTPTDGMTVNTNSSDKLKLRAMPMTASASASTDSSYYLTATIEPADAWETEIVWTVAFKSPTASWAKGKSASSYVRVTPSSDTLNATVTCLGGFGEQIIVTASSKDNPAAAATCTCDYIKRAENIVFNFSEINVTQMVYTYEIEPTPYTIDSEITLKSARIECLYGFYMDILNRFDGNQIFGSSEFSILQNDGFTWYDIVSPSGKDFKIDSTNTLKFDNGFYNVVMLQDHYYDSDGENSYHLTSSQFAAVQKAYISAVKASVNSYTDAHAILTFSFAITSNGKNYGSASKSVNINFTYDSIKVPVSTVTLNASSIIF